MAGPGRTPKLDADAAKAICDAIAKGMPRKHAAVSAGVGERTVRRWLARGRAASAAAAFRAFVADVKKAEAQAVARNVLVIQKAAAGGAVVERTTTTRPDGTTVVVEKAARGEWTAAAWWLERRYPEEFGSDRARVRQLEREVADLLKQLGGKPG